MKIYIIGCPGTGKTTLSKKLAKKYKTTAYELDCIVYDDLDNHRKRTEEEIQDLFDTILSQKSWMMEDVGRKKFQKGLEKADKIYYLDLPKRVIYFRILKRWIRQRKGKETYNYPPTWSQLKDMYHNVSLYYKKEEERLERIKKYPKKVVFLKKKDILLEMNSMKEDF